MFNLRDNNFTRERAQGLIPDKKLYWYQKETLISRFIAVSSGSVL
jgi:hypothetical protein